MMDSEISLYGKYMKTRRASINLCQSLVNDDYGLQGMPDTSPPKWHLAHTTWFFETFILKPYVTDYRPYNSQFEYLFNSYYNGVGAQYPRPQRGLLSRPTVSEVYAYRKYVDAAMRNLLCAGHAEWEVIQERCELGVNHEQQHQELFCTDIKYSFSLNPLYPALITDLPPETGAEPGPLEFLEFGESDVTLGYQGEGFCFDNEGPPYRYHQPAFCFANRLISNAEYLEFIEAGGYNQAMLWLSDGWLWRNSNNIEQPLYWVKRDDGWYEYTLYGLLPLNPHLPVSHISYYEADAYAHWRHARLATEQEWESVCYSHCVSPTSDEINLHPQLSRNDKPVDHMFGGLWQWTQSAYIPYPGYQAQSGAIGEYNGKFMCNQMVLRGSSCVTPPEHGRPSYRNFFYPKDRWQFSGIRLALTP
jgi:ergothioneine biosynthesis protein EgtB